MRLHKLERSPGAGGPTAFGVESFRPHGKQRAQKAQPVGGDHSGREKSGDLAEGFGEVGLCAFGYPEPKAEEINQRGRGL